MRRFLSQIPTREQVIPVYAVIVLVIYTWTIMWFFWKVPSWTFFLNVGEILTMLAYSLATVFAESLLVLCAPVLLSILLPHNWFRDVFIARGAALSLSGLGYMIFLANQFRNKDDYPTLYLQLWSVGLALAILALIVYTCGRIAWLRKIIEAIADRVSIFVYILVPLSIISVLVVLARSVF